MEDNASKLIDKDEDVTFKETDIVEGLTAQEGYGFITGLLILSTPLALYYMKNIYSSPYNFFKSDFETLLADPNYNNNNSKFTELYDEYKASLQNNTLLNHKYVLAVFLGFSYMALIVNNEDENMKESTKFIIASIVGTILFILKFIPSIMSFSENVFGYFFMNLFGSINLSLSLRNAKFKNSEVNIKLNQLMTIFNVENLGKKFIQFEMYNEGTINSSGETKLENTSRFEFFEHLLNTSIMKRSLGEVTLLVCTTLISVSLFKNY
jgi:hypothetical protein